MWNGSSVDCYNYNEATATTTLWESILIFLGSIIYLRVTCKPIQQPSNIGRQIQILQQAIKIYP